MKLVQMILRSNGQDKWRGHHYYIDASGGVWVCP